MKLFFLNLLACGWICAQDIAQIDSNQYFLNPENFPSKPFFITRFDVRELRFMNGTEKFRSDIEYGSRQGINFAGQCTLVWWGCGTSCQQSAIIDWKNQIVIFGPNASTGFIHSQKSNLLVSNPVSDDMPRYVLRQSEIYLWQDSTLNYVRTIEFK